MGEVGFIVIRGGMVIEEDEYGDDGAREYRSEDSRRRRVFGDK